MSLQISWTYLFACSLAIHCFGDATFPPYLQLLRLDRKVGRFENITMDSSTPFRPSSKGYFMFDNSSYYADFWAFDYHFRILAHRKQTFEGDRINVNLVSTKESRLIQLGQNELYHFEGSLLNYPQYSAYGYVKENETVFIINVPRDNIFIVPASEYNLGQNGSFNTVVYRESDSVNYWCSPPRRSSKTLEICSFYPKFGRTQLLPDRHFRLLAQENPIEPQCPKESGKHCSVWTVADHSTVMAFGSVATAVNEMLFHIRRVDCWFRATDFLGEGKPTNFGLKPVNITIFAKGFHFPDTQESRGQNSLVKDAVRDFSKMHNPFCMGLIFLLKSDDQSEGDIFRGTLCGDGQGKPVSAVALNMHSQFGTRSREWISSTVARMVAKIFGAETLLADSGKCFVPLRGGKYIMSDANENNLVEENNFKFSNCSIKKMGEAIQDDHCMQQDKTIAECGNGDIEQGEQCDCGLTVAECQMKDPCCVAAQEENACKLRPGARCSPFARSCCTVECKLATKGMACTDKTEECVYPAVCTGDDDRCPDHVPKFDGTLCSKNSHICKGGKCSQTICEVNHKKPCLCMDGPQNLCYVCCLSDQKECLPAFLFNFSLTSFKDYSYRKPAGYPCGVGGVCDISGECSPEWVKNPKPVKRPVESWSKRYWYIILIIVFVLLLFGCAFCPYTRMNCCKKKAQPDQKYEEEKDIAHDGPSRGSWEAVLKDAAKFGTSPPTPIAASEQLKKSEPSTDVKEDTSEQGKLKKSLNFPVSLNKDVAKESSSDESDEGTVVFRSATEVRALVHQEDTSARSPESGVPGDDRANKEPRLESPKEKTSQDSTDKGEDGISKAILGGKTTEKKQGTRRPTRIDGEDYYTAKDFDT